MGISREEYWSGLPCPSPGDLPHPGIEPGSPALQANSLWSESPGKPSALFCMWHHWPSLKKWNKILWLPDANRQLIGKDWCWERLMAEEKGMTEDEMVGWHPWFNGLEFEQSPEDGEGQGSLVCCKELHEVAKSRTRVGNWTGLNWSGHNRTWSERNQSEQALLYGLNCMTFWKWQNYEDHRRSVLARGWGREGWIGGTQRVLRAVNTLYDAIITDKYICPNLENV